ncbi:MAG: Hsp70 family protein, partial [Actinomycetota bacterium]
GEVTQIPPLPGNSPIEVRFDMDKNGTLNVVATEPRSGRRLHLEAQVGTMTQEQVERSRNELAWLTVSS